MSLFLAGIVAILETRLKAAEEKENKAELEKQILLEEVCTCPPFLFCCFLLLYYFYIFRLEIDKFNEV